MRVDDVQRAVGAQAEVQSPAEDVDIEEEVPEPTSPAPSNQDDQDMEWLRIDEKAPKDPKFCPRQAEELFEPGSEVLVHEREVPTMADVQGESGISS